MTGTVVGGTLCQGTASGAKLVVTNSNEPSAILHECSCSFTSNTTPHGVLPSTSPLLPLSF